MPIQIADAYSATPFAQRQTGLLFNLPPPDPAVEQLPEGVSLCMIVKNEERFLAECLESVKDCVDEICIVDTGSTDRTVEIARSYGAKIEFREWRNDFAWARNESLAMATKRWTLVLDGDEELTKDSVPLMRALRTTPAEITPIYINIINIINDPMGIGTMSHRLVRLFPTNPRLIYTSVIHEALTLVDGELRSVLSPIKILHKGYTAQMLSAREKDARNKPLLARAYEENGDDPFALFNFGNSAITSGDHETGIEVLERMLAMPHPPKMYYPLAHIMLAQAYGDGRKDNQKAYEILDAGHEKFPADAGLLFMRGQMLARLERTEEARADYERVIMMRDGMGSAAMTDEEIFEWKVYYAMAVAYDREGKLEPAIDALAKAIANKPLSPQLHAVYGRLNEGLGRYYEAESAFRQAASLDHGGARAELVNFLLRRQRFAQAIALVEESSTDGSEGALVVALNLAAARAMLQHQAGDPVPYLEAALRRAPGNGLVLALYDEVLTSRNDVAALARLHENELHAPLVEPADFVRRVFRLNALGRHADALSTAEAGFANAPDNAELRFNAAIALVRLGRDADAAQQFGEVAPTAGDVYKQAMQMRAVLLARLGDVPAAGSAIGAWVSANDDDANAVITGAKWLGENGGRGEARALLARFAETDRRVASELAAMYLDDGDIVAAGAIAERALR